MYKNMCKSNALHKKEWEDNMKNAKMKNMVWIIGLVCLASFGSGCDEASSPVGEEQAPPDVNAPPSNTVGLKGEYIDTNGPAYCCAAEAGTSCCEDREPGTCFQYGGIYGACVGEGEEYEAKVLCAKCCEGLKRVGLDLVVGDAIPPEEDGLPEGCDRDPAAPPPSIGICLPSGNGVCDEGEAKCNCPEDCSE